MIESRQHAYLEAMGVPVWCLREKTAIETAVVPETVAPETVAPASQLLKLGPGKGGILLICAADTESASKLANDIGRALGKVPVWSWPGEGEDAVEPTTAVDENLFTMIAVFGAELAENIFGSELPKNVNSANLVLLPSMHELETQAQARQSLWVDLCRSGMVSAN